MSNDNIVYEGDTVDTAKIEASLEEVARVMEGLPPLQVAQQLECCDTCDAYDGGVCRANGPTAIAMMGQGPLGPQLQIQSVMPPMAPHEWCAKWAPKRQRLRAAPPKPGGGRSNGSAGNSR
jgi:hypothetical protein